MKQNKEIGIYNLIYEIPSDTKVICADDLYRFHMGELQIYDHYIHCWRKTCNSIKQILEMKFKLVEEEYHRCDNWLEIESYLNKINNYCEYAKYLRYNPDKFIKEYFGIKLKLHQRIMLKMLNSKTAKYLIGRR